MTLDADPQSWPCAVCLRPSQPRVHDGCRQHIRDNLLELPGLYRQLEDALHPSRRGSNGRAATRTAPLPCNLDALDLRARGGIEGILGSWARDLYERERWPDFPQYGTVGTAVDGYAQILLTNLTTICDEHPAVKEFANELRQIAGQAQRLITGERPPRRVTVTCPCGDTMRVTLDTPGARCPGCSEQYGHAEVLQLPMAQRAAA